MSELFLVSIVFFALAGIVPLCLQRRTARMTSGLILGLGSVFLIAGSGMVLIAGTKEMVFVTELTGMFPVMLGTDRLTAVFTLLLGLLSLAAGMYTPGYLERMHGSGRLYLVSGLIPFFLLSMLFVLLSRSTFSFLAFWELMAVISFFLVLTEYEEGKTRRAALFYLAMTQISTVCIFLGIIALSVITGSFGFPEKLSGEDPLCALSFFCLFLGVAIKAGVVPFHKWLPYAHPAAPSPVSALMSGMMISTALYALFRIITLFYIPQISWGLIILAFGCLTAIFGVMYALKEQDLKGLLAYSSIDNTGIILIGIGVWIILGISGFPVIATMAYIGALFHAISHGIFKGLLFMTAGSVCLSSGTRNIDELGGILVRMPRTGLLFFIGTLCISAIPPFNGFVGELLIYQSLIGALSDLEPLFQVVMICTLSLFSLTSALTAVCFVKAYGLTFLALPRTKKAEQTREVTTGMIAGPAVLAGASILGGVFSSQVLGVLGYPGLLPDLFTVGLLLVISGGFVYAAVWLYASRQTKVAITWDCGMMRPTCRMEYTGSGFTEPVVRIFSSVYRPKFSLEKQYLDPDNCLFREGKAGIRLIRFFEEYLYLPAAGFICQYASRISGLQNGSVDRYVLYVFIAVVALVIMVGWSA
ncbi:MAG: hydrogenase membrane subunit [Methanospirillum sp.]|nr:hydrogenase membrane subunit [Methanospirillum sp.]